MSHLEPYDDLSDTERWALTDEPARRYPDGLTTDEALAELGLPMPGRADRPSDRERREHRDERAALDRLYARRHTDVTPASPIHNDDGTALERRAA